MNPYKLTPVIVGFVLWIVLPVISFAQNRTTTETDKRNSENIAVRKYSSLPKKDAQSLWTIKTNLLYWAALTPNVEVERYIGKRFSLNFDIQFAWWSSYSRRRYYQLLAVSPEARYWVVQKSPLHGHYIGLYTIGGYYDFMFEPKGNGYQGEVYLAPGVSYGYTKPISKNLSLELGIGFGYLTTPHRRYIWDGECYERQDNGRTSWFGPTKAKIALVWRLGKKGGRR